MDHAETCNYGMNDSGTCGKIDTPLTQPCSGFDLSFENTRRDLIALRRKYGADTPIGHRCSNIVEGLKNKAPAAMVAKQMRELQALLAAQ